MTAQLDVEALVGRLRELLAKIGDETWEVEQDPYGDEFPGICLAGSPYEMASFTAGEDAAENQARANLSVAAVNALPALLAHIAGEDARVAAAVAGAVERCAGVADQYVAMTRQSPHWDERTSKCLEAIGERIRNISFDDLEHPPL